MAKKRQEYHWSSRTITNRELDEGQKLEEILEHIEDSGWEIFQFIHNDGNKEVIIRRPRAITEEE